MGVDINERVITTLNNGEIHIHEPGLRALVREALARGNLHINSQPESANVFVIAVPTPLSVDRSVQSSDKNAAKDRWPTADLSYVISAAESIIPHLRPGNLVVLESTVPPRTTADVLVPILERSGLPVSQDELDDTPDERPNVPTFSSLAAPSACSPVASWRSWCAMTG